MVEPPTRELDAEQAGGAMTEHAPLTVMAIIKLLGLDWKDINFHTKKKMELIFIQKVLSIILMQLLRLHLE